MFTDENRKICPIMSKPGTQMHNIALLDAIYCVEGDGVWWIPYVPVDDIDAVNGGKCGMIK